MNEGDATDPTTVSACTPDATPARPPQPLIADRYEQVRRIGTGGMSVVVMAEDTVLKRTVALKLLAEHLANDPDFVIRFRHEALAAARLQHPNIVQVYDSGHDAASGRQFIVMEYVDGTPLSDMISGGRRLEADRATAIGRDACAALECAHRAGVIHRDVKPANLIVTADGTAKLTDFGIAKAAEMTRVTQAGSVLGTVAYLSPEQAIGADTGPRSDIYSLAVVIYEMLAGRPPYEYKSITELAMKQRDERPRPITEFNQAVPAELDHAVRVALSHDPLLRFASAAEFGEALKAGLRRRESEFVTTVIANPDAATRMLAAPAPPPGRGRRRGGQATAANRINPQKPVAPQPVAPPVAYPAQGRRRSGAKRFGAVMALLLTIAAAAVGGFLLAGSDTAPVIENTLQDQVDAMRGFIREHR